MDKFEMKIKASLKGNLVSQQDQISVECEEGMAISVFVEFLKSNKEIAHLFIEAVSIFQTGCCIICASANLTDINLN